MLICRERAQCIEGWISQLTMKGEKEDPRMPFAWFESLKHQLPLLAHKLQRKWLLFLYSSCVLLVTTYLAIAVRIRLVVLFLWRLPLPEDEMLSEASQAFNPVGLPQPLGSLVPACPQPPEPFSNWPGTGVRGTSVVSRVALPWCLNSLFIQVFSRIFPSFCFMGLSCRGTSPCSIPSSFL